LELGCNDSFLKKKYAKKQQKNHIQNGLLPIALAPFSPIRGLTTLATMKFEPTSP
jgi:hypothetical protein